MQIYVQIQPAVKLGFRKKIELQNGEKTGIEKWNKIVEAVNATLRRSCNL